MKLIPTKEKVIKIKKCFNNVRAIFFKYKIFTYAGLLFLTVSNYYLRKDSKTQQSEISGLKTEVVELKKDNAKLIADLLYFNRSFEDHPWPIWSKVKRENEFVMQWVNKSYYIKYLKPKSLPRYYFTGKTDDEIYNPRTASIFYAMDLSIALEGGSRRGNEYILDDDELVDQTLDVLKWREIQVNDTLIYGMEIPKKTQ